jgi:hypothetical protein
MYHNSGLNGDVVGYAMWLDHYVDPGFLDPLKAIYGVRIRNPPCFWVDDQGVWHRWQSKELGDPVGMFSDMGSIPSIGQLIIPKDRFLIAFIMHDSAYHTHVKITSIDQGATWQTTPIAFDEANARLKAMIADYPIPPMYGEDETIYLAVQEFGQSDWNDSSVTGD